MGETNYEVNRSSRRQISTIPSFTRIFNEWGYAGSRYQGINGSFSLKNVAPYQEHAPLLGKLPSLVVTGSEISPLGVGESVPVIAGCGALLITESPDRQLEETENRLRRLQPMLNRAREKIGQRKILDARRTPYPLVERAFECPRAGARGLARSAYSRYPDVRRFSRPGCLPHHPRCNKAHLGKNRSKQLNPKLG